MLHETSSFIAFPVYSAKVPGVRGSSRSRRSLTAGFSSVTGKKENFCRERPIDPEICRDTMRRLCGWCLPKCSHFGE